MKLSDLNESEGLALMAVLRLIISSDETLSAPESKILVRCANELGSERFRQLRDQAGETFKARGALHSAVRAVERPEAQLLLYRTALEAAQSDGLAELELERLVWIAEQWKLAVDPANGQPR
ncbi:MAG: hypothetical protein KC492_00075 [Myxococcales bacterium]|nr:hypothetical protein [Myxococcales bacterium]